LDELCKSCRIPGFIETVFCLNSLIEGKIGSHLLIKVAQLAGDHASADELPHMSLNGGGTDTLCGLIDRQIRAADSVREDIADLIYRGRSSTTEIC
jgi:hypothetical protein